MRGLILSGDVDIEVLGGGAWGCSAALALAGRGHDVTLVEPHALGAGATHKAAGILSALTWHPDEYRLITETRGMVGELVALAMCEGAMHVRDAWRPQDSLLVGPRPALDVVQRLVEGLGEETQRLDARTAAREHPALSFEPADEVLVAQEDGVLDAGALMEALRTRLAGEGVAMRLAAPGEAAAGKAPEATVVAAGSWSRRIVQDLGSDVPLLSFRTQLCTLEMAGEIPIVHDLRNGFYARPETESTVLAGNGTRLIPHDPDSYDQRTDPAFRDHIAQAVSDRFVHGGDARWRTGWAGLCAATPDRHPLCGRVPGRDDAWILAGDNGFGLMRCLALGERLADAVDGRVPAWLDPARFGPEHLQGFTMREGFGDLSPL